jgi:ABC-type multidrug transport system ATPase subunit
MNARGTVMSGAGTVIEGRGICKSFGTTRARAGVDPAADAGRVFALLGPNGAGKPVTGL